MNFEEVKLQVVTNSHTKSFVLETDSASQQRHTDVVLEKNSLFHSYKLKKTSAQLSPFLFLGSFSFFFKSKWICTLAKHFNDLVHDCKVLYYMQVP